MSITVSQNSVIVTLETTKVVVGLTSGNININRLSDDLPESVGTSPDAGDGLRSARSDHVHPLSFETVQTVIAGNRIADVENPVDAQDVATKAYVDQFGGGGGDIAVVSDEFNGLAPQTDNVEGQTLFDDGAGGVVWRAITAEDIVPAFAASLSGGGTLEVGQSVVNPAFTASYTSGPPTSATLTDTEGNTPVVLSSPFTAVTSPNTFTKTANNASVTFTLTAIKGSTRTASAAYAWRPLVFWGVGTGVDTEAEIEALGNSALASSRGRSFTVNAAGGQYIYYAFPDAYGAATFTVGGFEGGFDDMGTVSLTNAYGVTATYRLYRSTNTGLGSTNVVVS